VCLYLDSPCRCASFSHPVAPSDASHEMPVQIARMVPIGPGGLHSGFSILRYVRRGFRKKNRVRGLPAPPVAPRSWVP
jgi:hypothetical protein